ncbi:MAG: EAL domain-containing protein [Nitratireductor sp.]
MCGKINRITKQLLASFFVVLFLHICFSANLSAQAAEPVSVTKELKALDLSNIGDYYRNQDGNLKISTAPDRDGIVRRVEIKPTSGQGNSNWYVFALANETSEQIDRVIVAPHYRLVNSGLIWPDLDKGRIKAITPSEGFSLEAQIDREADVFLITLNPGAVITLIAELNSPTLPKLTLWEPSTYKDTVNSLTLYRGIVLGVSGLLAVFLTILFVVKASALFPTTAALAWGVLAYVCVDFGFLDRVIPLTKSGEAIWRAGTEVFLAGAMLLFFHAYLRLNRWNKNLSVAVIGWLLGLVILFGVVLFNPEVSAGLARFSFALTVLFAGPILIYLAFKNYDRAVMLIPTWLISMAWLFASWQTVTGQVANDIVQPALGGGLVMIVLLISFTVIQFAFTGSGFAQGLVSDVERQALALNGSGDIMWDWDVVRNSLSFGDGLAETLGMSQKEAQGSLDKFKKLIHANDRERFSKTLEAITEHKRGKINQTLRLSTVDGNYHWFNLKVRPMIGGDGSVVRCIGSICDVTDAKVAEQRLLQDTIKDNLTGLENKEIFLRRLDVVMQLAKRNKDIRPTVFHVNIDHFSKTNESVGFSSGDTILLTLARRLNKICNAGDSVARIRGDEFSILLLSETSPDRIASFADTIRKTLISSIDYNDEKIELTGSIGIASWTKDQRTAEHLMRDAELAMLHAKKMGGNRIEPFRPSFRDGKDDGVILMDDLRLALRRKALKVFYQPIVNLENGFVEGFEALVRWDHPKLGPISPNDFVPMAETTGLISQLSTFVLNKATEDFAKLHKSYAGNPPYVSINISSRDLLNDALTHDIMNALKESGLPAGALKIELTESLVMSNPEHSKQVLNSIKALGVGLSLDDFGTGYSSLSYLMRFPFDIVKIDSSFIQARNEKNRLTMLRSIIAMAHGLEYRLIAEGVELESDVTELRQMGCESAQGFLYGEPTNIKQVRVILEEELSEANS